MHHVMGDEKGYLGIRFSGKVSQTEYQEILDTLRDKIKEAGEIDVLADFSDLDQFTLGSLWEDLKFDLSHFREVRNFAVVGDNKIHKLIGSLSGPFVSGEAKFFPKDKIDEAARWVH